jgi:peroxiredoxin
MRLASALLAAKSFALPGRNKLKPGDAAPDFVAQASFGGKEVSFSLAEALRKGPVVLYFYPAAFTSGCTVEAHAFAAAIDKYAAFGASVIGVSSDNLDTLNRFSVSECHSKFPVAADTDKKIMDAYGARLALGYANRTSYVIASDGRIVYEYTALDPTGHVENTLGALRKWQAEAR